MSIADWRPQNYAPVPDPTFVAYLHALRPGVLRWPAGHRSQEYVWERGGGGQSGGFTLTASHVAAFLALAKTVGAEPVFAINVKRSTPSVAADIVKYLNVENGHGVRFFQIGNEPDLTDGMTSGPAAYAAQLIAFVDAMRAVDPAIRIVGPELLTGAHVGGMHGTVDWMTPILAQTGGRIDGISWHYYPLDSGQRLPTSSAIVSIPHLFQQTASDWAPAGMSFVDTVMPALGAMRDAHALGASIWITELAEDPGPAAGAGVSDTIAAALWTADTLGRYGEYAPGAVLRWIFETVPEHAYGLLDGAHAPRPTYGAYWLYARHMGDRFVDVESSSSTAVAAHAALRADGALTVVFVNKTEVAKTVHLTLDGFCASAAEARTLTGASLSSTSFQIDGQTLTASSAEAGLPGVPVALKDLGELEIPPASIRMVSYRP